ncbi:rhamnogalacturonan lyase family protein [Flavobacterium sp. WC2509]|uniref:rhamnogalacturonan lyase family protein n=1 Tax=Flavobacterium sp. WC2509 TaxID=3461406 RepID=UPI004043AB47
MKKQIFFESKPFLLRKMLFRLTIFTVFSFLTTQFSFAQTWPILGNEQAISSVASSYTSIAVVNNGVDYTPYVAYTESGVPKVKKRLNDGSWVPVGANLGTNATFTQIYADPIGNLYVAYIDGSSTGNSKLAIQKYDFVNNIWSPLNPADNNTLYVSTGNVNQANSSFKGVRFSIAFDSFNTLYVAFTDAGLIPYVKKFNSDTAAWETVGSGPAASGLAALPSLAIDSTDKPWLLYTRLTGTGDANGTLALFSFNGTSWTESVNPTPIGGIRQSCIANNGKDKLCIAMFDTGNSNKTTIVYFDKTTGWSGKSNLSTRDGETISLINDTEGNVYCSYIDKYDSSAYAQVVRVHKLAAGNTSWSLSELRNSPITRGIDEPTANVSIAIGSAPYPYLVYIKANSLSVKTPIVRSYVPAPPPAVLTTNAVTNITTTTAISGGNITSDGGQTITERGVAYSNSNANPTTADSKVADIAGGVGNFSVTLSGLSPGTFYYARAYAINSGGPSYGSTIRLSTSQVADALVTTPKQVEFLNRGLVAIQKSSSSVYLSWRLLGNDPQSIAFNVYRNGIKVNSSPITTSTNYLDNTTLQNNNYSITTIINGVESQQITPVTVWPLNTFIYPGNSAPLKNNKLSVPIQIPPDGTLPDGRTYSYTANDASVGDVDGDGTYEIILKWEPTIKNDNAGGYSGKQIFDCYKLDGTRLWRIDLGINVNSGPHYNQFMVYDFDGDGKAEIILKTADGTIDGAGNVIGNSSVDYRSTSGFVQNGPEFLTVFNGLTGAAMSTINYQPSRDNTSDWGDSYGNRQDRFVSAVAYLDGARPSLIVGRGYYNRLVRAAYNWRDGQLTMLWKFDSKDPAHPEYNSYSSQGNHQMTIGDVDGDGKDEVINGSSTINDDGKPLWTYGMGHGDALNMTDMDLDRPGQEIWINLESPSNYTPLGLRQYDAKTGKTNWGIATGTDDVGRSMAADIDPNYRGYEMWGSSGGNVWDSKGNSISTSVPTYNFGIWWDGDLGRELADKNIIDKWNPTTKSSGRLFTIYQTYPVTSNNDTKSTPCLQADILGDWREETILRKSDNTELVIFTTDTPTTYRIPTLMHDPQYRVAVAWQNSGYNQPPNPSFYIGYDMATDPTTGNVITPTPNIYVVNASVNSLGLSNNGELSSSAVKIYPNPTSGLFSLQLEGLESGKANVKIIGLNGQTIKQRDVLLTGKSQTVLFDISAEATGVYLIQVTSKEGVTTQKIILQK